MLARGPSQSFAVKAEWSIQDAVGRLHDFRHGWEPGDIIDDESDLMPEDLDVILAFVSKSPPGD